MGRAGGVGLGVEAISSSNKGGGASVGKPNPGSLTCVHAFNRSSTVELGYICTGRTFPKIQLDVTRDTGSGKQEASFVMTLNGVFLTKVSLSASEEGRISQRIELIFKTVAIDYRPQDTKTGSLGAVRPSIGTFPRGPHRHRRSAPDSGGRGNATSTLREPARQSARDGRGHALAGDVAGSVPYRPTPSQSRWRCRRWAQRPARHGGCRPTSRRASRAARAPPRPGT